MRNPLQMQASTDTRDKVVDNKAFPKTSKLITLMSYKIYLHSRLTVSAI